MPEQPSYGVLGVDVRSQQVELVRSVHWFPSIQVARVSLRDFVIIFVRDLKLTPYFWGFSLLSFTPMMVATMPPSGPVAFTKKTPPSGSVSATRHLPPGHVSIAVFTRTRVHCPTLSPPGTCLRLLQKLVSTPSLPGHVFITLNCTWN